MARDDDFGSVLAAGLLGFGAGLLLASEMKDKKDRERDIFRKRLTNGASVLNLNLRSSTLGRTPDNSFVWLLTVAGTRHVRTLRASVDPNVDPYSEIALNGVLSQLRAQAAGA